MRQDIENALASFEVNTFGNKKYMERLIERLSDDEQVVYIAPTNVAITNNTTRKVQKMPGVFALTTKRILFRYQALADHVFYTCDLSEIKMVSCHGNGLTGGHIEIHTLMNTYDVLVKYKKQLINKIQLTFDQTIGAYKQSIRAETTNQNSAHTDVLGQVQKLFELKEMGVISEQEFITKKADLLAKL